MSNGSHIRAVPGDGPENQGQEPQSATEDAGVDHDDFEESTEIEWVEEPETARSFAWIIPTLAAIAIAAWTAFFAFANQQQMLSGGTLQQWIGWVTDWAMPVVLVLLAWLIAMRSSSREASRFGDAAHGLAMESARLEERLATVNRELSLAREFLGSQTRDLEALGRTASERISQHADRLQTLVHDNGEQVDRIATVSGTALENMDKLRDDLPVIANSARDVSNQIGSAGRTAKGQLSELVAGFERLNEFGTASEQQVTSLQSRIDKSLTAFREQADQLETIAAARFDALREESAAFRTELDGREVEALAAIRSRAASFHEELDTLAKEHADQRELAISALDSRIAALCETAAMTSEDIREGESAAMEAWSAQVEELRARLRTALEEISTLDNNALRASNEKLQALAAEAEQVDERLARRDGLFNAKLAEREKALEEAENRALASLSARIREIDTQIAASRDEQSAHLDLFTERGEEIAARLASMGEDTGRIAERVSDAEARISRSTEKLSDTLQTSRESLDEVDTALSGLTDSSVRLLELIQASARKSKDELPAAIADFESRLEAAERHTDSLRTMLGEAQAIGNRLGTAVSDAEERGLSAATNLDEIAARIAGTTAQQVEALDDLRSRLSAVEDGSVAASERVQGELQTAITALEGKARAALSSIESDQANRIKALADSIGQESGEAIDRAIRERIDGAIGELDSASVKATTNSHEAAIQLRDQLAKVNELTKNLEARVARAREQAEEQADNDFSRRVALITDSLNSNAIDIGKALSTEVTDTAWAAYLKGDRGIFTRRAVKLLDTTELRDIADLYDADHEFHEHVSRYIHDFEAMLRTLLSTRNGNALGVTVLSSDMGKLYVALAQAIERLRD